MNTRAHVGSRRLFSLCLAFCGMVCLSCATVRHTERESSAASHTVFNVRSFGAVGDGKNLDSPAIDKAIQAASAAAVERSFFPPAPT